MISRFPYSRMLGISQPTLQGYVIPQSFTPLSLTRLFYNSVNCKKLMIMQFVFVHRNANEFSAVEIQLISALQKHSLLSYMISTSFAAISKLILGFPIACKYVYSSDFPLNQINHLTVLSLINKLDLMTNIHFTCLIVTISYF